MAIFDAHAHIYPDKVAPRAVDSVGDFYLLPMAGKGTSADLLRVKETTPITNFIVHSVAVKPEVVESINDFIAEQCRIHPEFVGFATMHQDYPDKEREIERVIELGLKGVKLHADTQKVNMDDPRLMELYEILEGRLPVVQHVGDYRYDYSHPRRMQRILKAFPDLVVDAAHFGGWSIFDIGIDYLRSENCFVDTCSTSQMLGARRTKELVNMFGIDRVMFGSDFPLWGPTLEFERFTAVDFTDDELDKLLGENAENFIGTFAA